jgi:predicted nucleic acid-binding protein
VKIFLDTSVLVALFYGDHPHHDPSVRIAERLVEHEGFCSAHSLMEVYSTLTRMPRNFRASPERARLFIADLCDKLQAIALTGAEYAELIDECAATSVAGGRVYDALHARCAMKASADVLFTWNVMHFLQFREIAGRVKTPDEVLPL